MTSRTAQDYIKQIYLLGQGRSTSLVPLGRVARALGVTPGTVTTMVKSLHRDKAVQYIPRRGVRLSAGGEKLALAVLRRHRLVELFLSKVLGLPWGEVHAEAEELEHAISDRVLAAMDEYLGNPSVDPHGDPIPDVKGNIKTEKSEALAGLEPGARVRVVRVIEQGAPFLDFLEGVGITLGAELGVVSSAPESGAMMVEVSGRSAAISLSAAERVYVSRLGSEG